jgi:hypothetical protein
MANQCQSTSHLIFVVSNLGAQSSSTGQYITNITNRSLRSTVDQEIDEEFG